MSVLDSLMLPVKFVLLIFVAFFYVEAYGSTLEEDMNSYWPKPATLPYQSRGVLNARQTLDLINDPNVFFQLPSATLLAHIQEALRTSEEVRLPEVTLGNQIIELQTAFEWQIPDTSLRITGRAFGDIGVTFDNETLRFLPILRTVRVDRVIRPQRETIALPKTAALNVGLRSILERVNQAWADSGRFVVSVSSGLSGTLDVLPQLSQARGLVRAQGDPIVVAAQIGGMALKIDASGLTALGLLTTSPIPAVPYHAGNNEALLQADFDKSYDAYVKTFEAEADRVVGPDRRKQAALPLIAIRRDAVARILNAAFTHSGLCIEPQQTGQLIQFETVISAFKYPQLSCTTAPDCFAVRACDVVKDCSQPVDQRNCLIEVRLPLAPSLKVPDQACEAARAQQNLIYATNRMQCEAAHVTERAECEQRRAAEKVSCEMNAVVAKRDCELIQVWLRRVAATKSITKVAGSLSLNGNVNACIRRLALDSTLENAEIEVDVGLSSRAVNIAFRDLRVVPDGEVSYAACKPEWNSLSATQSSVVPQVATLRGLVDVSPAQGGIIIDIALHGAVIPHTIDPPPFVALFAANPQASITCVPSGDSRAQNAKVTALRHEDLDRFGRLAYRTEIPTMRIRLPIHESTLKLATGSLRGEPIVASRSVMYTFQRGER